MPTLVHVSTYMCGSTVMVLGFRTAEGSGLMMVHYKRWLIVMKSKELKNSKTYGFILSLPHLKVQCEMSAEALHMSGSL